MTFTLILNSSSPKWVNMDWKKKHMHKKNNKSGSCVHRFSELNKDIDMVMGMTCICKAAYVCRS